MSDNYCVNDESILILLLNREIGVGKISNRNSKLSLFFVKALELKDSNKFYWIWCINNIKVGNKNESQKIVNERFNLSFQRNIGNSKGHLFAEAKL